jgi:hypothetical protein
MQATYVFCLGSEIKVEDGDWPQLSFERDGKHVSIEKPLPRTRFDWQWDSMTMHSKTSPPPEWFPFEAGRDEFGATLVTVRVTPPAQVSEEAVYDETRDTALATLQEFVSWARVLTRQYWIGRRGRASKVDKYLMYIGEAGKAKPRHSGAAGWGFDYATDLSTATWGQIGDKLALGQRPSPSVLFFCDALLDIAEGDVAQAVAGLGVSCEVEIYSLMQDVLRGKSEEFQRLYNELVRLSFKDTLSALVKLECKAFREFDPVAYDLVLKLYRARGKAVHQGAPFFREQGRNMTITHTEIPKYVQAVEKLFAWADAERSRLALGGNNP